MEIDEILARDAETRRVRGRFRSQLFWGGAGLLAMALGVTYGSSCLLDRARDKSHDCLNGDGDPGDCHFSKTLLIPKLTPHLRAEAVTFQRELEKRIARAELRRGGTPAAYAEYATPDEVANELAGRFVELAAVDLGTSHVRYAPQPAFAAMTLGDVPLAKQRITGGIPDRVQPGVRAAALACLLGDRARSVALVARAHAIANAESGHSYENGPQLVALHCKLAATDVGFDPTLVGDLASLDARLVPAFDPAFEPGHRAALGDAVIEKFGSSDAARLGGFALAVGPAVRTPLQILRAIGRHASRLHVAAASPWIVLRGETESVTAPEYVPPEWLELGAAHVAAAIGNVPKLDEHARGELEIYEGEPDPILRGVAYSLWLEASILRLRHADRTGAAAALAHARELDDTQLEPAAIQLALGDPKGALATIDAFQHAHADAPPRDRATAYMERALAAMATGDAAEAYRAARSAIAQNVDDRGFTEAARWLLLATEIASNGPLDDLGEPTDSTSAVDWAKAYQTHAPPPKHTLIFEPYLMQVLPAVAYVVAKVSGKEAMLDEMFSEIHPSRAAALARAEAARWRGDEANGKLWTDRATVTEKLLVDDHAVVLAGLAGLW